VRAAKNQPTAAKESSHTTRTFDRTVMCRRLWSSKRVGAPAAGGGRAPANPPTSSPPTTRFPFHSKAPFSGAPPPARPPEATGTERRTVARWPRPPWGLFRSSGKSKSRGLAARGWPGRAGRKRKNYTTGTPVKRDNESSHAAFPVRNWLPASPSPGPLSCIIGVGDGQNPAVVLARSSVAHLAGEIPLVKMGLVVLLHAQGLKHIGPFLIGARRP
jgi:hypothetical protein